MESWGSRRAVERKGVRGSWTTSMSWKKPGRLEHHIATGSCHL